MDGFDVEAVHDDGVVRFVVRGELDAASAPELRAAITGVTPDGRDVVLDLGELEFIDSSGLSALVAAHKHVGENGGVLVIERAPASALRLFTISGLDQLLTIR